MFAFCRTCVLVTYCTHGMWSSLLRNHILSTLGRFIVLTISVHVSIKDEKCWWYLAVIHVLFFQQVFSEKHRYQQVLKNPLITIIMHRFYKTLHMVNLLHSIFHGYIQSFFAIQKYFIKACCISSNRTTNCKFSSS